ncbi:MAG: endonuclease/exonuclease/phosphatase family protein [Pirellulales bacterium]|nr:endonuclease/exonuclease/phosphatase family protein [Pirellulales bacterium]
MDPHWIQLDASEPVRLRVLSYNIHHGEGTDGKLDLHRIAEIIRSTEPDLVALQECDRKTGRSGAVDQPAELGRLTNLHVLFGPNIDFDGGAYGNAILSRQKPERHANHHLPRLVEGELRGLLDVMLDLGQGRGRIRFLATHLDHRPDDAERMASAGMIEKLVKDSPNTPTILAGDLNALPKSQVMDRFRTHWTLANQQPLATFPANDPNRQIDYILVRPKDRWRIVSTRVVEEPVASDHRPIMAELELLPNAAEPQPSGGGSLRDP